MSFVLLVGGSKDGCWVLHAFAHEEYHLTLVPFWMIVILHDTYRATWQHTKWLHWRFGVWGGFFLL
jgi:hypothetical protein